MSRDDTKLPPIQVTTLGKLTRAARQLSSAQALYYDLTDLVRGS